MTSDFLVTYFLILTFRYCKSSVIGNCVEERGALAMLDATHDPLQVETVCKRIWEPLIDVESSDSK